MEAKATVALNESQSGSKSNSATMANAAAAESATKKSDSVMPVRKSRRGLLLRNNSSPCEITLPIRTTG